jgi:hypothetical protein
MKVSEFQESHTVYASDIDPSMSFPRPVPPTPPPIKPRLMRALPANLAKVMGNFDDLARDRL